MKKQDKINASRRDFIKHSSLGVAGASMGSGVVGSLISTKAEAAESKTIVTAAHWGPLGVVVEAKRNQSAVFGQPRHDALELSQTSVWLQRLGK